MSIIIALYGLPVIMIGYLVLDILTEKVVKFKYRKEIKAIRGI